MVTFNENVVNYKLALACQLRIGTCQDNNSNKSICHLSAQIEPYAAAADDLWLPLRVIQGKGWVTLCSRETG